MSTAPSTPTKDEVEAGDFHWEYDQAHLDISTLADPPGSVPPTIVVRRRMVSHWETYTPALTDTAEPQEET